MSFVDAAAVRRYLLGQASDRETSDLERQYFDDASLLDEIAGVEDELIEDYLDGRLDPTARDRFERYYLSTAVHRARVEAIRRMLRSTRATVTLGRWVVLAAAAVLVLAVAGALWLRRPSPTNATLTQRASEQAATPLPRVLAFSVAPLAVRSATDRPSLVIPFGIDTVALDLERGDAGGPLSRARAVVRTISGVEVWSGPAVVSNLPTGIVARAEVPAMRLTGDDYTITLLSLERDGREREVQTYFLRVRGR